jgi:hypothetical protein
VCCCVFAVVGFFYTKYEAYMKCIFGRLDGKAGGWMGGWVDGCDGEDGWVVGWTVGGWT